MKYIYSFIISSLLMAGLASSSYADTYPEVIFDNSLVQGVYAKSKVDYTGQSWVENLNHHLLVSDTLFFTPGNALSLQYKSAVDGNWIVDLQYTRQKLNYKVDHSDFLVFKVFLKTENTKEKDLPKIGIQQGKSGTNFIDIRPFMDVFDYNMWINVKIPIAKFSNLIVQEPIAAVRFMQNRASKETHQIFIDQMEFLPKNISQVKLSSPAILSSVVAYDKQVQLKWQLPLTPSIRYIKIYRSTDNKEFTPVAIRPIYMQSCLDYVPDLNKTYYYKIAWVDYNYVESPFSQVKEIKTKNLNENELMDLVQGAHINYFVENYDINSGMYLPFRMKDRAVVSVKESGNAVLSLIVGVERNLVNRQVAIGRVTRIVNFLSKSQNRFGVFPAYFDGRTGLPDYRDSDPSYDVLATSSMMEALLVARQYFTKEEEAEVQLRKRISTLYENIEWNRLLAQGYTDVLQEKVSGLDSSKQYSTLGGINESLNAYLLAMGSPTHSIPLSAYENGIKNIDIRYSSDYNKMDSLAKDTLSVIMESFRLAFNPLGNEQAIEAAERISVLRDTAIYGEDLIFGYENGSLLDFYKPFFTIDPNLIKDPEIDYEDAIRNYIKVRKRRDNEIGVGSTNSDIWGFYQLSDSVGSYRINPAIAPASMFLLENEGRKALLALYGNYGENFFNEYGFRAWLDLRNNDVSDEYFATNQAAITVCLENARSGLIWKLYKEIPEIKTLLQHLPEENQKGRE
ncbi:glucoamylase family protein [Sphingobacterium sp. LRF_L2]|uniref:glucoamylase family protein n=1 Tax=Sphingobacterium sp. LRF_L2 TaxID=3369421 RepID=UPI003F62D11A